MSNDRYQEIRQALATGPWIENDNYTLAHILVSERHGQFDLVRLVAYLLQECASTQTDAARYRWLRDHGFQHAVVCLGTDLDGDNFVSYRIDFNLPEPAHMKFEDDEWGTADVDAAIDAAMRKEERHDNQ